MQIAEKLKSPDAPAPTDGWRDFREIDWAFVDRAPLGALDRIHPYPAKFIPDLPAAIMDCWPVRSGTAVFDPFMGSGTTLVEAQRRGYESIGVDVNPIGCLISQVKTGPHPNGLMAAAETVVKTATIMAAPDIPRIPNLAHWFKPAAQDAVARLQIAIQSASRELHPPLRLALSSILVRVSNQESDTRYAAIEKEVTRDGVFNAYLLACRRLDDALSSRRYPLPQATVMERDTLSLQKADIRTPIGAVITSPPYPNAYEYWLYHKYRMWWLGYNPLLVKEQEIGARAHFFKKNHHTADRFVEQMRTTFTLIDDVLVQDGYACFVIGRSKIHGKIIDNAAILDDIATASGYRRIFDIERPISATKKSFNLSHANIKTEHVLVFSR